MKYHKIDVIQCHKNASPPKVMSNLFQIKTGKSPKMTLLSTCRAKFKVEPNKSLKERPRN